MRKQFKKIWNILKDKQPLDKWVSGTDLSEKEHVQDGGVESRAAQEQ